jgi:hypothetical protein
MWRKKEDPLMNNSEHAPDQIDAQLQAHLDCLNAAFTAFKRAETETLAAENRQDGDKLIRLWHAKNQAAQTYMQEWDYLSRYGEISFDEQTETLHFSPKHN